MVPLLLGTHHSFEKKKERKKETGIRVADEVCLAAGKSLCSKL